MEFDFPAKLAPGTDAKLPASLSEHYSRGCPSDIGSGDEAHRLRNVHKQDACKLRALLLDKGEAAGGSLAASPCVTLHCVACCVASPCVAGTMYHLILGHWARAAFLHNLFVGRIIPWELFSLDCSPSACPCFRARSARHSSLRRFALTRRHDRHDRQSQRSCGLEIDYQLELGWLFDWESSRFRALQNLINIRRGAPE
jgi:hypothetical protein